MNFLDTCICQACLSDDRTLHPLYKLQPILKELQFLRLHNVNGGLCWECRTIIMKINKFKNQVLEAQQALYKNFELNYVGNLTIAHKNKFDFIWNSLKPVTNKSHMQDDIPKTIKIVKVENLTEENVDLEDRGSEDNVLNSSDTVMSIELKDNKCLVKKHSKCFKDGKPVKNRRKVTRTLKNQFKKMQSNDQADEEELRDKFVMVTFTEDEMIKNREEKMRQPNFKKLPYKCDSCVLGFTRKETYDLHYEKKHNESIGPHVCAVCGTRFAAARALDAHSRRHYLRLRCRLCRYETRQRGAALAHCGAKHAADTRGRIHCAHCRFVARTPEELTEHQESQHTLYCNECGEKFKGKHTLRTHKIRIHTSNRQFSCGECNRTFKTKSRLESHMATHNATLAQSLAYCAVCKVQYKNIYVYRNHLKNSANHSERLYHCEECDKRFASKVYWQKHRNFYHLKKSQFKCDVCNKLLISDWRLKNHMQTRHGSARTRNHACHLCAKKFYTMSTLRAHCLTHSTQRSYMCEQCGDTFKQRAALHTHMRALHAHTRE